MLTDTQLLQYSRQIMLPKIDIEGQQSLLASHVAIIGLGGLGSPVAMYLAAAGVGELTFVDDDKVELTNLQRQVIHKMSALDTDKVESAKETVNELNAECLVNTINQRLDESSLLDLVGDATVVVDCSDNFDTRFLLNRVCYSKKTPLVSGAAIRWEGQVATYLMKEGTPCYRCLYEEGSFNDQTCVQNGVVAPLVGIIGSIQAMEVIKLICHVGKTVSGRLMLFDGLDMEWRMVNFKRRSDCPVCG